MKKRAKKVKRAFLFTYLFNLIYTVLTLIFIFLTWTSFEINHQFIKSVLYLGVLFFTPVIFIWDIYFYKVRLKKTYKLILPVFGFIYIFYLNPLNVFNSANKWKTSEILYQSKENSNIKIEVQERKLLTSNRIENRTVIVNNFNKYFKRIKKFNEGHIVKNDWNKIDN
jgi:hypothetical protein